MQLKAEEKRKKREAKEAKKRAEERAKLRGDIQEVFIKKGVSADVIAQQDLFEIDGNRNKNIVGVLGGVLGQLIITLALMERNYNRQLTSKSTKSKKSGKSGGKSQEKKDKKGADKEVKDDEAKKEEEKKLEGQKSQKEIETANTGPA